MKAFLLMVWLTARQEYAYRAHIAMRMLVALLPLVSLLYLWRVMFSQMADIAGYDYRGIITYTVFARLLFDMVSPTVSWQLYGEISTGDVAKYFSRPFPFAVVWIAKAVGGKLVVLLVSTLLLLAVAYYRDHFVFPAAATLAPTFLSVLLSFALFHAIYYNLALMAFWLTDVWALFFMMGNIIAFGSGALIPLSMMPERAQSLAASLPFVALVDIPMSIFMERRTGSAVWEGLAVQTGWLALFSVLAAVIFRRGARAYAVPGG
jgi:ABC-2 type transport system permease protein